MQFKLSTLMVMVAAVALGCMGWKLGHWMIYQNSAWVEPSIFALLALCGILLPVLIVVGGRPVALCSLSGFAVSELLLWAVVGPPVRYSSLILEWTVAVPIYSFPLALFAGSLRLATNIQKPVTTRYGFLLPSCLMLPWGLAVWFYGR